MILIIKKIIYFKKSKTDNLAFPLKWKSENSNEWFFEKQSDGRSWIEYKNKKVWLEFREISISKDDDGYPIVILKKRKRHCQSLYKINRKNKLL